MCLDEQAFYTKTFPLIVLKNKIKSPTLPCRNHPVIFQILIDNCAFVNPIMRNSKGHLMTPLDAALYRGYRGCAKFIQLHGGVPASKITDKTALERALSR